MYRENALPTLASLKEAILERQSALEWPEGLSDYGGPEKAHERRIRRNELDEVLFIIDVMQAMSR